MSKILIAIVTLIYVAIAVDQGWKANWQMCIVYAGYAFANVGLLFAAS